MLITTGISNEATNEVTIYMQYYVKKNNFYISSTGKIESVQEFKMKLFEQLFYCRRQSCQYCMATCSNFHRTRYFAFLR